MALSMYVEPARVTLEVTEAEYRVLDVFLDTGDLTNAQIGRRLSIAEATVKTHMRRLIRRSGCASRTGLAVAVLKGRVRVQRVADRPADVEPVAVRVLVPA